MSLPLATRLELISKLSNSYQLARRSITNQTAPPRHLFGPNVADHPPILTTDNTVTVENSRATRASMKARLPCAANAHLVFLDSLPICEASNSAYSHSGSVAIRIGSS